MCGLGTRHFTQEHRSCAVGAAGGGSFCDHGWRPLCVGPEAGLLLPPGPTRPGLPPHPVPRRTPTGSYHGDPHSGPCSGATHRDPHAGPSRAPLTGTPTCASHAGSPRATLTGTRTQDPLGVPLMGTPPCRTPLAPWSQQPWSSHLPSVHQQESPSQNPSHVLTSHWPERHHMCISKPMAGWGRECWS